MGRTTVPTRPPSSGAVVFYARARADALARRAKANSQDCLDDHANSSGGSMDTTLPDARLQTSVDAKENALPGTKSAVAKGSTQAVVFALALSKEIVELFSEVPYVKILAGAVQQVILIYEEVTANKERCAELIEKISLYSKVVFDALMELKKPCSELESLKGDLEQISSVLDGIHKLLANMIMSSKSIIRRVLGREELAQKLGEFDRKLDTSITLFQLKSSIVLRFTTTKPIPAVPEIAKQVSRAKYTRQYSKPYLMVGRDEQISTILTRLLTYSSAKLCISGSGGVGKSSLALSVLHDESIIKCFGDNRYFVSCEAATSPDLLVGEIAYALGIDSENRNLLQDIRNHLRQNKILLVLDNFETCWDPLETRSEAEHVLYSVYGAMSVIVTMRGAQKPSVFFNDHIVLSPLDTQSAEHLFYTISNKQDEYVSQLVDAVGCLPLAVTLVANLAAVEGETTQSLWIRWQQEHTSMIENGHGRLNSLDASIKLSLTSQIMESDPGALTLLSTLSMLPDGLSPDLLLACESDFPEPFLVRKALSTLRRSALVQEDNEHYIKVLNPIRLYTQSHHPPSPKVRSFMHSYFLQIAIKLASPGRPDLVKLRKEAGNVHAILCDAIRHASKSSIEGVLDAVFSFCQYSYVSGAGSVQPMLLAEQVLLKLGESSAKGVKIEKKNTHSWNKARRIFSGLGSKSNGTCTPVSSSYSPHAHTSQVSQDLVALRADLLGCAGQLYSQYMEFGKAITVLKDARRLHIQAGDKAGQAYDLLNIGLAMHRNDNYNDDSEDTKEDFFEQALTIHKEIGDMTGQAHGLVAVGYAYYNSSEMKKAFDMFLEASVIFSTLKDDAGLASTMYALGLVDQAQAEFSEAENRYMGAAVLYKKLGDQVGEAQAFAGIAVTWLLRSRFSEALEFITKAIQLRESSVDPDHIHVLGRIYVAQEEWIKAREVLEKSLRIHEAMLDVNGQLADHTYLAKINLHAPPPRTPGNKSSSVERMSNPHTAAVKKACGRFQVERPETWDPVAIGCEIDIRHGELTHARTKARLLQSVGVSLSVAHARHLMGIIKLRAGLYERALECFEKALMLHTQCDNVQGQADDINGICEVLMRTGEVREAGVRIQDALALHVRVGCVTGQGDDLYIQGCVYLAQGALEDAEMAIRRALMLHRTSGCVFGQGRDLATLSDILWQKNFKKAGEGLNDDSMEVEVEVEVEVEGLDNAEDVLEEAMELFTRCRARGEYWQCLKLKTERKGETWVEVVYRKQNTEISAEWPLTYETE